MESGESIIRNCVGYEYYPENYPDIWNKEICNLKKSVVTLVNNSFVTSGRSFYVCPGLQFPDHEAIGQNIDVIQVIMPGMKYFYSWNVQCNSSEECRDHCSTRPGCVGISFSSSRSCFLKSNIQRLHYERGHHSEQVCYRPSSYINMSVSMDDVLGKRIKIKI